ncbi:hypothetical protein [Sphingomonas bacterium]|uniref:hypothetical protein n=1 Tax=Sphingomonas bacterium TaxID=1895847 RepID=UPI001576EB0B|nr:hypothetical protein [Sphingomonas bacterium]
MFDPDVLGWLLDRKFSLPLQCRFNELRIGIEPMRRGSRPIMPIMPIPMRGRDPRRVRPDGRGGRRLRRCGQRHDAQDHHVLALIARSDAPGLPGIPPHLRE